MTYIIIGNKIWTDLHVLILASKLTIIQVSLPILLIQVKRELLFLVVIVSKLRLVLKDATVALLIE